MARLAGAMIKKWQSKTVAARKATATNEMSLGFVSSEDDWEDYDILPIRETTRPPKKFRGCRIFDGVRFGRNSRHGAKTPRHKTCYRKRICG